jgi:hypothetical protein
MSKREISEDVTIVEEEGRLIERWACIPDATSRIEKEGLMEEMQRVPPVRRYLTKNIGEYLGQVMRIERERSDPSG